MVSPTFDLIVIGGGPAGAMAAYHAARAGLSVLILEKASFPRLKPCGGGLTIKTIARIPFSLHSVLYGASDVLWVGLRDEKTKQLRARGAVAAFTLREQFDSLLLDTAIGAGAELRVIKALQNVVECPDGVTVQTDGGEFSGRYLVGADGANSQVRRMIGAEFGFHRGFALEGLVPYTRIAPRPEMTFDFGCVDYGYGWLFPKSDHVNVGLYTCSAYVPLSKNALRDYCEHKLGTADIDNIVGYPLGMGGSRYFAGKSRVLLVGDAAGLVEPLYGEGLHNAVKSGELAGQSVAAAVAGGIPAAMIYDRAMADVRADIRRCSIIAWRLVYPYMDLVGYRSAKMPILRSALMNGYAAGKTIREITNNVFTARSARPLWSADVLPG